jgi:rRNA maturation RNase YbeY
MHGFIPIQFHFADVRFTFPKRTDTKRNIQKLISLEGKTIEHINYIFCSDSYLLDLNQQYLQHDTLTDIITFHYHQNGHPILSDIYISWDRIKENARLFKTTYKKELLRVIFHGALHLCGYKDKTKKDQEIMRKKENYYLELFA